MEKKADIVAAQVFGLYFIHGSIPKKILDMKVQIIKQKFMENLGCINVEDSRNLIGLLNTDYHCHLWDIPTLELTQNVIENTTPCAFVNTGFVNTRVGRFEEFACGQQFEFSRIFFNSIDLAHVTKPFFDPEQFNPNKDSTAHNLTLINEKLDSFEAFTRGLEVNFRRLSWKLIGTTWAVDNPIFCMHLIASDKSRTESLQFSVNFETDKEADTRSHFQGQLPPPMPYQHFATSPTGTTILLSVKGGVNSDTSLVNHCIIRREEPWKEQRESLNKVYRRGVGQTQELEERLRKPTNKLRSLLRKTLNLKRRLSPCCSRFTLSSLREGTSRPLVFCLWLLSACFMFASVRKRENSLTSKMVCSGLGY